MKLSFSMMTATGLLASALVGCGANVIVSGDAEGSGTSGSGGSGGAATTSPSGPTGTPPDPVCAGGDQPIDGLASAIATPNAGNGWIEINLSSAVATCEDPYSFPESCATAWRLRLALPPDALQPGTYPLSLDSTIFAYLDGQEPGAGQSCKNTGIDFAGTLVITEIDTGHVAGFICDHPTVHGTFSAPMCGACKGVGQDCTSDGQCCNQFCNPDSKHCDP